MSGTRPLILAATRAAIDDAARLGIQRVLEVLVGERIAAGAARAHTQAGSLIVDVGPARVVCLPARSSSGRKGWRPVSVHPS